MFIVDINEMFTKDINEDDDKRISNIFLSVEKKLKKYAVEGEEKNEVAVEKTMKLVILTLIKVG